MGARLDAMLQQPEHHDALMRDVIVPLAAETARHRAAAAALTASSRVAFRDARIGDLADRPPSWPAWAPASPTRCTARSRRFACCWSRCPSRAACTRCPSRRSTASRRRTPTCVRRWASRCPRCCSTLLDAETPVHLAGALGNDEARGWLRFHTGARGVVDRRADDWRDRARTSTPTLWNRLDLGSDEAPQSARRCSSRSMRCPTSRSTARIGADVARPRHRAPRAAWPSPAVCPTPSGTGARCSQAELPRGVDLVLVCGSASPRSRAARASTFERGLTCTSPSRVENAPSRRRAVCSTSARRGDSGVPALSVAQVEQQLRLRWRA